MSPIYVHEDTVPIRVLILDTLIFGSSIDDEIYSSTSTPGLGIEPFTPGIQSRSQDNGPFDIPSKEQIRGMVGPATFAGAPSVRVRLPLNKICFH